MLADNPDMQSIIHPLKTHLWLCETCVLFLYLSVNLESRVVGKSRYGSLDTDSGEEGHDGDHGKTSVVKLSILLLSEGSSANSREVNWREDDGRKSSSLGVVGSLGLGDQLSDEDGSEDLSLSSIRDSIPSIEGLHSGEALEGNIGGEHTREVDSSSLDDVSGGSEHSNTGVLELCSTEPSEGFVGSGLSEVHRVEGSYGSSSSGHAGKVNIEGGGSLGCSSGCEGSGGASKSEEKDRLHFVIAIDLDM